MSEGYEVPTELPGSMHYIIECYRMYCRFFCSFFHYGLLVGTVLDPRSTPDLYFPVFPDDVVVVFSSHSFWTPTSLDVPAGVTQEEDYTGFLIHLLSAVRALIFLARRIQPFLSLVDREVEFCVLTI